MLSHQVGYGRLEKEERKGLSSLFQRTLRTHLHLDWRGLESWSAHPDFRAYVARENGRIRALVGATLHGNALDPNYQMAWLRFIVNPSPFGLSHDLTPLYTALKAELTAEGVREIAILSVDPWVDDLAVLWGFTLGTSIITLQREGGLLPRVRESFRTIRPAREADLDVIARLDARAFSPIWHYDRSVLAYAMLQSATFTVLEMNGVIAGYQLSSGGLTKGHLARLAVEPACQGHGIGRVLTEDMILALKRRGLDAITVNTQADNLVSQELYRSLGFVEYGRKYPVWVTEP